MVIFTSREPSLAVTYNSETDSHTVFRVRRVTQAEAEKTLYLQWQDTTLSGTPSSHCQSASLHLTPSRLQSTNSPSQSRSLSAPFTPFISRSNSPSQSRPQSRAGSPLNTMASMIRTGDRQGQASPNLLTRLQGKFSSPNRSVTSGDASTLEDNPQPLQVSLCFDQLWTEQGKEVQGQGRASKVFLATDLVDQNLICILRSGPNPGLQLVKMETANDNPDRIIFGAVKRIPCRDAVPMCGLNMILVLDLTGSLILYSGTTKVSKVLLSPSPATILSHEISALALDNLPAGEGGGGSVGGAASGGAGSNSNPLHLVSSDPPSLSSPCTPLNYKRSSLLTSSRPPSAALPTFGNPDSTTGFLSPVTADPAGQITRLRDAGPHSCCLELSNSRLVKVSLPTVAGHTVSRALAAIKLLVPRDLATLLQVTWYNDRHAPGPCPAPDKEWEMFCRTILALAGYQVDCLDLSSASNCSGPVAAKKSKSVSEESGCDNDWQQLLLSAHHSQVGDSVSRLLGLDHPLPQSQPASTGESPANPQVVEVNTAAPLFSFLPAMFWSLHLLYEEAKLDSALFPCQTRLATLLSQLAHDLQMTEYQHHYWRDFPSSALSPGTTRQSQLSPAALAKLAPAPLMTSRPPSVLAHLRLVSAGAKPEEPFPLLTGVTTCCELLSLGLATLSPSGSALEETVRQVPQPGRVVSPLCLPPACKSPQESLALFLSSRDWDLARLTSLPPALSVPLLTGLAKCQTSPPSGWPAQAYTLIGRDDLAAHKSDLQVTADSQQQQQQEEVAECDGLEGVLSDVSRARWPEDQRLEETRRLLQSSRPVTIPVTQRPEVSDHDFLEEQEHYLKRLCERTMALSVGRGVAALRTVACLPTEILDIPKLCLTGRAPPRGAKVEMNHIDVNQNMEYWPLFHNGVAAGLRLSTRPESTDIDSTWICFNKPTEKDYSKPVWTEHAGFLMALGLNGHLSKLGKWESYEYLLKSSESISIGILLGMAASKKGSMDVRVTKKLATQLEALLPPTTIDMPLSHNTQVAALMGVGLLYSGTSHRRMVEMCLKELGRPPGPELENCVDRESYSLTAGLAMGMIMMGQGDTLTGVGLADLQLASVLHNHMVGGPRHAQAREKPHSYQIMEGDCINVDITSPGATLALGMMYWRSNNQNIASWMSVPETAFLLEFVRPDFLMLRIISAGLIMWDSVVPSLDWVESFVPAEIRPHCLVRPPDKPPPGLENLDYETINQAYCNIMAGACFLLGLRFAGTWNQSAMTVLSHFTNKLIAISKRSLAELTGRAVIEQTLCVLVLAQGLVMAGSGDLEVMRTCRMLRARVHNNNTVTYGSHMAVHLALALLYLGGGKLGLSNSPEAVAALICAFYPKFPTHSSDNRYHLQAFRHLYVLAVEPRVLVPRSSDSGQIIRCEVEVQYSDSRYYPGLRLDVRAPVLLPSLSLLASVSVSDTSYWSTVFKRGDRQGWDTFTNLLHTRGDLTVKKKAGARLSPALQWSVGRDQLGLLEASSKQSQSFLSLFLSDCPPHWVARLQSVLSACLASSTPGILPVWTSLLSPQAALDTNHSSQLAADISNIISMARQSQTSLSSHQAELALSLSQSLALALDLHPARPDLARLLLQYLTGSWPLIMTTSTRHLLAATLILHSLPTTGPDVSVRDNNPLKMAKLLRNSSNPASLFRIIQ